VRVHYKKTWQYERKEMVDRSTIGLYFAPGPAPPVSAVTLAPSGGSSGATGRLSFSRTLDEDARVLAVYPGETLDRAAVVITATAPGGTQQELISFHPRAGWARRFWFREPIALERGTKLAATVTFDDPLPFVPLSGAPGRPARPEPSDVRLTLNVVTGR